MTVDDELQEALNAQVPHEALDALVLRWSGRGHKKAWIVEQIEQYAVRMRETPGWTEEREELLFGVLDALTGWCHPSRWLLADEPTEAPPKAS